jgi:nucleotide-binding universal stress UspA family protein
MFKNVLVGVDGREHGRDAIALAFDLIDRDGQVTIAHVHRDEATAREDSHALLEQERDRAGVQAELVSVAGDSPAHGLHQQAEEMEADLLIVGSCHRSKLGRVVLGDDSRGALDGAPCTVAIASSGYAASSQTSGP